MAVVSSVTAKDVDAKGVAGPITNGTTAGATVAGAFTVLVVWALTLFGVTVPPEVASAFTVLVAGVVGWLVGRATHPVAPSVIEAIEAKVSAESPVVIAPVEVEAKEVPMTDALVANASDKTHKYDATSVAPEESSVDFADPEVDNDPTEESEAVSEASVASEDHVETEETVEVETGTVQEAPEVEVETLDIADARPVYYTS